MLPVTAGYPGDPSAKRAAESPVDDPSGPPQAGKFEPRDELSATCRVWTAARSNTSAKRSAKAWVERFLQLDRGVDARAQPRVP